MTIGEMEIHIRQLELIVLDLLAQSRHGGQRVIGICVNTSLHHRQTDPDEFREHPTDLLVPHYTWQPQVNWGLEQIHLHPENRATP